MNPYLIGAKALAYRYARLKPERMQPAVVGEGVAAHVVGQQLSLWEKSALLIATLASLATLLEITIKLHRRK